MKRIILHLIVALLTFLMGVSADLVINSAYYNRQYPADRYAIPLTFDPIWVDASKPEATENCKCV